MNTDREPDSYEFDPPSNPPRRSPGNWTPKRVILYVLAAALLSVSVTIVTNWNVHRTPATATAAPVAAIAIATPQPISGPGLAIALPKNCTFLTRQVDANGGNWWYISAGADPIRVLIATSRLDSNAPLDNDYFQNAIAVVEQSTGDMLMGAATTHTAQVGNYAGERGSYNLISPLMGHQHAEAILLRREHDDLLIVIYGDFTSQTQLQTAAQKIFGSLIIDPTPPGYDLHSA